MFKIFLVLIFTICLSFFIPHNLSAIAQSNLVSLSGEQVFEVHCAGCHVNGGNILRRGKNLRTKALHKYGYDSVDTITEIVSYGKNNMSAYNDRLSETEIKNVAEYVLSQAENNWKS